MAVPIGQLVPSILAIITAAVILILLSLNYLLNRFPPTIFLSLFFGGILLWAITKLVSLLLPATASITFVLIWKITSLSILILSLLMIAYFRDLLLYSTLSLPSVFVSLLAGFTFSALWFGGFAEVEYNSLTGWNTSYNAGFGHYVFYVILLLYLATVYFFILKMMVQGLHKAILKKQKTQIALIVTGLAIAAIGGTVLNYLLNLIPGLENLGDMDLIFVVIGFTFVAGAYLRSPIHIYFAPIAVYKLIVINKDGLPLLTHDFNEESNAALTIDSAMISSALSGVINILQETLSSGSTPKIINLEDKVLLLENTSLALYALITDKNSAVLRAALKDFSREFEAAFIEQIKKFDGLVDVFEDAYNLIVEDFPFVVSD
ncbi:MAG: hypothetical protein ACTSW0_02570 [Candidatus Heimdallarchaeota archaeon]